MNLKDLLSPFFVWQRAFEKPYTTMRPTQDRPGCACLSRFSYQRQRGLCRLRQLPRRSARTRRIDMVRAEEFEGRKGDSGLRPRFDYGRCCWCGLCVDICTAASLRMSNEYTWISERPERVSLHRRCRRQTTWQDNELGYRRADGYHLYPPKRIEMEMLAADESVQSFDEVVKGYSEEQAKQEADRCVECGICVATCPAHMDVPDYIHSIRDGDYEKGLQLMYRTNPFPATCGRICTRRCESVCPVGILGETGCHPLAETFHRRPGRSTGLPAHSQ